MTSNDETGWVISLDVGGTSIKSGIVAEGAQMRGTTRRTPIAEGGTAEEILGTFRAVIAHALTEMAGGTVLGIGVGVPGPFDYATGVSLIRHKFAAIYGVSLRDALAACLPDQRRPVLFRNDAEAAIVGEALYGAGRAYRCLIGVTLGTGLGTAFIRDGLAVREGADVPPGGELYPVPYGDGTADDAFSIRGLLSRLRRLDPSVHSAAEGIRVARAERPDLQAGFQAFGAELGRFLAPFVRDFSAEAVIILGGLSNAPDIEVGVRQTLSVPAMTGELGDRAAILGAAAPFFSSNKETTVP
ncbi:MAG: ROK family protein [Anaerolineae bacterium]